MLDYSKSNFKCLRILYYTIIVYTHKFTTMIKNQYVSIHNNSLQNYSIKIRKIKKKVKKIKKSLKHFFIRYNFKLYIISFHFW